MGFVFPWEHWLRNELKDFCHARLQRLAERGIFEPATLHAYWDRFQRHDRKVRWNRIWLLTVLEEWLENNAFH
jgi:asparagine synthase (glutamine-hydrolysing)